MYNKKIPKNFMYSPSEEPMRPMRPPIRPINGHDRYDRERLFRPRRYPGPPERVVRGGMRGASRITRNTRESWREYSMRGRSLRENVSLRGGRGGARGEYLGIRGRDIRDWRSIPYSELGRRERSLRADIGFRGRGIPMRGMRGGRGIRGRGIPRGPRGYSPRIRREES
ncbi:hypothetical protein RclHR1_00760027 [Rhizophagus clarus]|uniref:Uncharacterized protein n=1 Tax=Rhizophagus clarus TaxID=94130 RepID=A0A2Z6SLC4_9GLOM|nr:hypothetical protein RclHR1_00760027 [Rhizophagus clarus]GES86644.1 hypothetical protein GLOIN_2v1677643 [Rhizophagus clarus]